MHRWLEGGEAEAQTTDVLDMTSSSSSGSSGSAVSSGTGTDSGAGSLTASSMESADDKNLELWLSISIPLILLLAFAVVMFFCCKRQKKKQAEGGADLEAGPAALPALPDVVETERSPLRALR